jgi:hypothetical protein
MVVNHHPILSTSFCLVGMHYTDLQHQAVNPDSSSILAALVAIFIML